ncbi:tetratricopeptide repeat protein [Rhodopseudomonas sp. B29]|uniref:tetratricopeptide repeat protein n=1 Tax=Rhodopseudomonas sp. B29 TaxID=95607 RepID=UPI0003458CD3|nr:tetratricopeptide repeat protein [Rhodopseudomonas sp. B29]
MAELFDEVDEEVRREQLKRLWDKYSIFLIALLVLIIAGVGGWKAYEYYQAKQAGEAGAAFNAAADLAEQNKRPEAAAAFEKLAATAPSGYRTLARLRAAAETSFDKPTDAVKQYDAIAADSSVPQPFRDLASVRAARLVMDSASYTDMAKRLETASGPNGVYRHTAREMLALSAWRSNDVAQTRKWLDQITNDAETPSSLRGRADVLQALLPPAAKS